MSDEKNLTCNGQQLKTLAAAGLSWLEGHYQHVNELNVFPVPDGDTGTNMLLTMRNANKEIADLETLQVSQVARQISHGAIMGSRGNSGTIMSQLWKGFADALDDADVFDAPLMVKALRRATDTAYRGVQRPVEGTILTVAREMTEEAESNQETTANLLELLDLMVTRGWDAVKRTPDMLPVLKDAGVVDSGGVGLMYVIEGMLRYLKGETVVVEGGVLLEETISDHEGGLLQHPGENIYDVQFVIKGHELHSDTIKSAMEAMGDSVVVAPGDDLVKVHVHVRNPGHPLEYAANVGQLTDVVVENMLEQYLEFAQKRQKHWSDTLDLQPVEPGQVATVTVVPGYGLAAVFQQLGVSALVNGGQTNNPSVEEFVKTINDLDTDKIILLPNNKNVILTAQQVVSLVPDREVSVVPTRSVPQGVSAMLAYQPTDNLHAVSDAMNASKDMIITGEVTIATRSVELDGIQVQTGQVIGLLDGALRAAGDTLESVVQKLLALIDLEEMELVTLYYGADVREEEAKLLTDTLAVEYSVEFEIVEGGQPHYPYILSVE